MVGPDLTIIWLFDIELMPEIKATGAAIKSGHGEATTITSANLVGSFEKIQAATPITNEMTVNGTA